MKSKDFENLNDEEKMESFIQADDQQKKEIYLKLPAPLRSVSSPEFVINLINTLRKL